MNTMCIREMFSSFNRLNKDAECQFIASCDESVAVQWHYGNLTYTLKTTFTEMTVNTKKLQRAKHQAKLIMRIRTNLRRLTS